MRKVITDIAWAAGLFEGEGCVHKHNASATYGVAARISMSDRDVLESFRAVVGMGRVTVKKAKSWPSTRKPMYQWYVTNRAEVEKLFALLGPYLHDRRFEQFSKCLPAMPVMACEWCGGEFTSIRALHTHNQGRPRYCSVKCRYAMNNHKRKCRSLALERS